MAAIGNFNHLLKDFLVNLAFIRAIEIPLFFAFKIKLGQISESTRNIFLGFHLSKNASIKCPTSKGIIQKGARIVFSPTGIATGLFYAGGKFFDGDGFPFYEAGDLEVISESG